MHRWPQRICNRGEIRVIKTQTNKATKMEPKKQMGKGLTWQQVMSHNLTALVRKGLILSLFSRLTSVSLTCNTCCTKLASPPSGAVISLDTRWWSISSRACLNSFGSENVTMPKTPKHICKILFQLDAKRGLTSIVYVMFWNAILFSAGRKT